MPVIVLNVVQARSEGKAFADPVLRLDARYVIAATSAAIRSHSFGFDPERAIANRTSEIAQRAPRFESTAVS
jgi:hypothetical protein